MSYLLGSKACIESLAADVQDLQDTINEVISRVGPMQTQSWKFPDKKACDLDIDDLLDLYDYDSDDGDDPEARQISHIALYELVIDRLIFLVQTVSKFCSFQQNAGQLGMKQNSDIDTKMVGSVGLIIKQFWACMLKSQTQSQQYLSENKQKEIKMKETENKNGISPSDEIKLGCPSASVFNDSKSSTLKETPGMLGIIPPNNADLIIMGKSSLVSQSFAISKDSNNKSCQTFETAFVPCESCDVIQRKLREAGDVIINVCTDQGLPCSLKKFKVEVSHVEMLSFNDTCRWMAEQNKDIARIGKQNVVLQASIDPMKSDMKTFEKRTKAAEEKAETFEKNMKEEMDVRADMCKHYENKLQDQEQHFKEQLAEEDRQKCELKKNKENLEKEVNKVKNEVEKHKNGLKELEINYKKLENELQEKKKDAVKAIERTQEVADLKYKLAEVTSALESHTKILAMEQGKCKSASRHNESLQAKQDSLLARMDLLGKENEDLSQQVASLEDEKSFLEDALNEMREETKSLNTKLKENEKIISDMEAEKRRLEKCMKDAETCIQTLESELNEVKDREKMLVEYPDLNGPVNTDLQGTGDVALDMQNQIIANTARIKILEEQNQTLSQSIQRLSALRSTTGIKSRQEMSSVKLVPLWQSNNGLLASQRNNSSQQHGEEWEYQRNGFDKKSTPHHPIVDTDNFTQNKHKQFMWTHTKKEDEGLTKNFQMPGLAPSDQEFLVSRGTTPQGFLQREDKSLRHQRPPSGRLASLIAPVNATPIGAYTQIKKSVGFMSGKDNTMKARPPSGKQHSSKTNNSSDGSSSPFSCPHCDKMYMNSRDLDIHLTYCVN